MRKTILLLTILLAGLFPARGQQAVSSYYFYDGLLIRSIDFIAALDSTKIQKAELITEDVQSRYQVPEGNGLVIITTKPKENNRLKEFTASVYQIVRQYPFVEFSYQGRMLDTDSERVATFNTLKVKKIRTNFYVPQQALKKFGERGENGVIEVVPK